MNTDYSHSQQCLEIALAFTAGLIEAGISTDDALSNTASRYGIERSKLSALWFDYASGRMELYLANHD